jgi:hypothetical protein
MSLTLRIGERLANGRRNQRSFASNFETRAARVKGTHAAAMRHQVLTPPGGKHGKTKQVHGRDCAAGSDQEWEQSQAESQQVPRKRQKILSASASKIDEEGRDGGEGGGGGVAGITIKQTRRSHDQRARSLWGKATDVGLSSMLFPDRSTGMRYQAAGAVVARHTHTCAHIHVHTHMCIQTQTQTQTEIERECARERARDPPPLLPPPSPHTHTHTACS